MPPVHSFSPDAWREQLSRIPGGEGIAISVFEELDSTNTEAKRRVSEGVRSPGLIVAHRQTAGRGRMGRSFFSPAATGAYFTLYWSTESSMEEAVTVTGAASVAVMRAIRRLTGKTPDIKWVNDLYLDGRKLAGILAESVLTEAGATLILGIGINLTTSEFPEELQEIAGSLGAEELSVPTLIAAVVEELMPFIKEPSDHSWLEDYRKHSCVLGREITWIREGESYRGVAEGIDESGALLVRDREGKRQRLFTGEITLRVAKTD